MRLDIDFVPGLATELVGQVHGPEASAGEIMGPTTVEELKGSGYAGVNARYRALLIERPGD